MYQVRQKQRKANNVMGLFFTAPGRQMDGWTDGPTDRQTEIDRKKEKTRK